MAPDFHGDLGNLLTRSGFGILSVSSLAAAILMGSFCSKSLKNFGKFLIRQPQFYYGNLFDSAMAATILASAAVALSLCSIFTSAIIPGQKTLIKNLGAFAAIFSIGCIISEGLHYHFRICEYIQFFSFVPETPSLRYLRNNSKAQEYIISSLEKFYDQGVISLRTKYPDVREVEQIINWTSLIKLIGREDETNHYFNYPDLWQPENIYKLVQDTSYLYFGIDHGLVKAYVSSNPSYNFTVASLNFVHKSTFSPARLCCWNASFYEYKCKTLNLKESSPFLPCSFESAPWTLNQYIMMKNKKYETISQYQKANASVNYLISGFPIAYRIVKRDEVESPPPEGLIFTTDSNHFKVSAESFSEKVFEIMATQNTDTDEKNMIHWCKSEPEDWNDAFVTKHNGYYKCTENVYKSYSLIYPITNEELGYKNEEPLKGTLDNVNVGHYPQYFRNYFRSQAKTSIFDYSNFSRNAQYAIGLIWAQALGLVLWAIGLKIGI